ncbi:MAG: DUF389 domain-containing protein [Bacteroidales bacterium]|nr:DUF389 domain-containing protein [Bacteroidales bacterium]
MSSIIQQIKSRINFHDSIDILSAKNQIISNIEFKGSNVWILIFAIVIASVGLNVNSIPVVIGAMLISPLMGPIMGVGLALGINDTDLLKRSFKNLLIMSLISVATSTFYFIITPLDLETPTELLARTNPTVYDVFIAFFGGLAVITEVCKKDKGTVIAGAAIATALMPPLCTAGFGMANGNFFYFIGALYLFFINSVFIALASFLMVRYLKFPLVKFSDETKQKKVHRIITAFTIILIIPSIYSAVTVIKENNFNQAANKFVAHNKTIGNSYIYDHTITHRARKSTLSVSIAGEALSQADINKLHEQLHLYGIEKEQFHINQNSTFVPESINEKDFVKSIYEQNEQEIRKRENLISEMEKELKAYRLKELPTAQIAKELSTQHPEISALTLASGNRVEGTNQLPIVIAILTSAQDISKEESARISQWLAVRLDAPNVKVFIEKAQ